MVVAVGHNIFEVTVTPIPDQRPPQFLVPEDDYIICECSLFTVTASDEICLPHNTPILHFKINFYEKGVPKDAEIY